MKMKRPLIAMLVCLCGCSTFKTPAGSLTHLDAIIIPHLALENVSLSDAVVVLHEACALYDPRRLQSKPHGFSFVVTSSVDATTPADTLAVSEDPFAGSSSAKHEYPKVSIHATDRSMTDILHELCTQAGAEFSIRGKGTIFIQPKRRGQQTESTVR